MTGRNQRQGYRASVSRAVRGEISVIAELAENEALVRIKDNGCGIQADTPPYIIDLFIQANHSLARSEGGLGSGLT